MIKLRELTHEEPGRSQQFIFKTIFEYQAALRIWPRNPTKATGQTRGIDDEFDDRIRVDDEGGFSTRCKINCLYRLMIQD